MRRMAANLALTESACELVPVPVTAPDLDDRAVPRHHNVRTAGKVSHVQPEPETLAMEQATHDKLGSAPAAGRVRAPGMNRTCARGSGSLP